MIIYKQNNSSPNNLTGFGHMAYVEICLFSAHMNQNHYKPSRRHSLPELLWPLVMATSGHTGGIQAAFTLSTEK